MYRLFVVLLTFSLVSLNVHAAKGGRWGGSGESSPKPGKKIKTTPADDSIGPVISLPGNMTISASTGAGAIVTYAVSANDAVDGAVNTSCNPQSGQVFALGSTTVQCSATDLAGNVSSDSFTATVIDDQPPVITVPAVIQQSSPDGSAVVINFAAFDVSAVDMVDSQLNFDCVPSSGSAFVVGTTAASCTATDDAQNTASAQFSVVIDYATPTPVNTPPQVAFATPATNALLAAGDTLAVNLNASDSDGSIQYCTLHLNGSLLRQENVAPYQWGVENNDPQLVSMAEGEYSLVAACTDSGSLVASVETTVLVQSAPEPEPEPEPTIANVLLDWVVPATREDGSALPASEIDSYEIYYYSAGNEASGTSLNVSSQDLAGNLISSYPISSLNSGQYYFSIATVDTGGNVSEFVTPVSLTLQ